MDALQQMHGNFPKLCIMFHLHGHVGIKVGALYGCYESFLYQIIFWFMDAYFAQFK